MHVFVVMHSGEGSRADAKRIFQDQALCLFVSTKTAFGTFVIALAELRAFFQQFANAVDLCRSNEPTKDGEGAKRAEGDHLEALQIGRGRDERAVAIDGEGQSHVDPGAARKAQQDREAQE